MTIFADRSYARAQARRSNDEDSLALRTITICLYAVFFVATIGVNYRIVSIGEFPLTPAPFGAVAILLTHVRWGARMGLPNALAGFFLLLIAVYPVITWLLNGATQAYDIPFENQLRTYLLWGVNLTLLAAGFYAPIRGQAITLAKICMVALVIILLFGIVQSIAANAFGETSLYNVFGDHFFFEKGVNPRRFERDGIFRAISLFYEPSFFGRTCICLGAVAMMTGYRPVLALILAGIGALLSLSAGSIILLAVVIAIWTRGYVERRVATRVILTAAGVATVMLIPFITVFVLERIFQEVTTQSYNSGFVRVALPLEVLSDTLARAPFGVPLGANRFITANHPGFILLASNELKVTSGVYEMIMYTGVLGIAAAAGLIYLAVTRFIKGAWRDTLLVALMLLGTIVSSSLLAFENTIQFLPIIVAWRLVRQQSGRMASPRRAAGQQSILPGYRYQR